jgi:hypothetical protein
MPTYSWQCVNCQGRWENSCLVAERNEPQRCPTCDALGERDRIYRFNIDKTAAGGWNQQSFNPGLGCWTKSTKHGEQIAKSRGLEPVGNEKPETIQKHFETAKKEERESRWANADRELVYE